jgi:signal transduction histidine kinase
MKDIGLERLLNLIIYRLVKTMRISYGSICLNDEDSNTYIKKASRSLKVKEVIATREELPHESAFIRFILAHRKEFLLEDVQRLAAEEKPKNNQHSNNNHSANEIDYSEVIAQMHQLNARLVIPSFLDKELIGFLVLGEKASGKPYSATDIEVLVVLSRSASLAILNALFTIKLRSRERELADASRIVEIGNLASATEHQLGNVLNNIMNATCGMLDNDAILDSLKNSPEAKAAFERIANVVITNASDGDQIIEEIRSYSRQEEDRQFSLVNLKDVLDKTLSMLYIQINKFQNIDITVTIGPDVPAVLGSPIGLQNIFVNMLNNAYDTIQEMIGYIKLHPEAGMNDYKGKIDVTIRRVKGNVDIHISDNGKGMAPDIARKLFSPHYTTKASSDKRKEMKLSGGTGIGLFTIRFLVKDYGGTITLVKTEPFKGADFLIQLPVPRKEGKGA